MIRVLQVHWDDTEPTSALNPIHSSIHVYDSTDEYIERIGLWMKTVIAKGHRHQVVVLV